MTSGGPPRSSGRRSLQEPVEHVGGIVVAGVRDPLQLRQIAGGGSPPGQQFARVLTALVEQVVQFAEIARYVGVSTKTIRVYHSKGLLAEPERDASGYRRLPQATTICCPTRWSFTSGNSASALTDTALRDLYLEYDRVLRGVELEVPPVLHRCPVDQGHSCSFRG
ncbi:MerR family transcriptional regulator [Kribbella sp. CA-293567]|uniref:MerR family transcriptional regulator n=1 Tax=Kribbella sp. CA-293567 TaxID=3002436 RepID=UPI0022DE30E0|nr:MerR family DNA-binding transcriptional regulator [Kribbella sp. CA-293567]WBQ07934.1 MerR family DNA-binding transcriptional regulator [Kribbella sp. CA-293567]